MWWWLLACSGGPSDAPAPGTDTAATWADCDSSSLRYDTFGEPLIRTWCTPCHSASVPEGERAGAPVGIDFDTYDDVLAWADPMAGAIAERQTMPPTGGLSDEERRAFAAWVDCGAPEGSPLPTLPVVNCDDPVPVDALDCSDPAQQPGAHLTTDLTADGVDLGCLCAVDGDLQAQRDVVAPRLERIGGDLRLQGAVQQVLLDRLWSVGGDVHVEGTELTAFDLPRLDHIDGGLSVVDNPRLTQGLRFASVHTVGGSVVLADNDALATLVLLSRVTDVGGDVSIRGHAELHTVAGLSTVVAIGGQLRITDAPAVQTVSIAAPLVSVGDGLSLTGLPALAQMEALPALSEADTVVVDTTGSLSSLPSLPSLQQLDTLTLTDNAALTELSSLSDLEQLVDVTITGNPSLPQATAHAFVDGLDVAGAALVEDNGP